MDQQTVRAGGAKPLAALPNLVVASVPLAIASALISAHTVPHFYYFGAPLVPGISFGIVLGVLIFIVSRNWFESFVVFVLTLAAWICAYQAGASVDQYIRAAIKAMTGKPEEGSFGLSLPAFSLALCGAVGGVVGGALVALAVSAVRPEFRTFAHWARLILIGTAAGTLLECVAPVWGFRKEYWFHVSSFIPMFLVWQTSIAACIAHGIATGNELASFKMPWRIDFHWPKTTQSAPRPSPPPSVAKTTTPKEANMSPAASSATPSASTAYVLNILLPGAGNIYFGQPIIGTIFILAILLGLFMLFFGASAAMLGVIIIVVSAVAALFTFGISLVIGVPIGLLFLVMAAGPVLAVVIYFFSLIVSELLVHSKAKKTPAPTTP